ncbi:MAG: YlzJ-like family protein [Bacilli bacterium]
MIFHTVVPLDQVFPPDFEALTAQSLCNVDGVSMVVSHIQGEQCFVVERIVSTNPYDYLKYTPGERITY